MSDTGDAADSRTAAVGNQRARSANSSGRSSRDTSSRPSKRQRRNRKSVDDASDMLPRGASFSATPLEVDPSDTSSSGSSDESVNESEKSETSEKAPAVNPHKGSTAPAISWNQGRKSAIRTTLGKRKAPAVASAVPKPEPKPAPEPQSIPKPPTPETNTNANTNATQFSAVNHYWKSRDQSASPEPITKPKDPNENKEPKEDSDATSSDGDSDSELEEGEIDSDGDSTSVSQDSEADNSIMLNIGSRSDPAGEVMTNGTLNSPIHIASDSESEKGAPALTNGSDWRGLPHSKEEAFRLFARTYPTPPVTLLDLNEKDLDIQVKFYYIAREILGQEMDLELPIGCILCKETGHLAEVCPVNECTHCQAWASHSSHECPTWRRCQKCRERGHHEKQCTSALKSSASEVPCDHCGSQIHTEAWCLYKSDIPIRPIDPDEKIYVSICCAHCLSRSHLIGDCPSLPVPMENPFFSLKGIPPENIVDLNKMPRNNQPPLTYKLPPETAYNRGPPPPRSGRGRGRPGGRGGINARSPSPSSDDGFPQSRRGRGRPQPSRGSGRGGHIRFADGVGSNRNGPGPDKSRGKSPQSRGRPAPKGPRGRGSGQGPRGASRGASRGGSNSRGRGRKG